MKSWFVGLVSATSPTVTKGEHSIRTCHLFITANFSCTKMFLFCVEFHKELQVSVQNSTDL